eukprot:4682774-Pyramimonas_sp.AAC.1
MAELQPHRARQLLFDSPKVRLLEARVASNSRIPRLGLLSRPSANHRFADVGPRPGQHWDGPNGAVFTRPLRCEVPRHKEHLDWPCQNPLNTMKQKHQLLDRNTG